MKKGLLSLVILISTVALFSGCIKNGTNRTIEPIMTASLGTYSFEAASVQPSTVKPQLSDSSTTLYITGIDFSNNNKIVLGITKYKGLTGTFSLVQGTASVKYYHQGITSTGTAGVVAITDVTANTVNGYFSFTTDDNLSITNGTFGVGKPWDF
jgi:hypothetical protein